MTRQPEALDKLVAIWDAGLGSDVRVIDGPLLSGAEPEKRVYVGYNGDPDGDWLTAADSDQQWAGTVGAKRRDETFTIPCAAVVRNGAGNVKAARDAAYTLMGSCNDVLRANVTLGFPPPSKAQMRNPSLSYALTEGTGVWARVAFDVEVSTRI